MAAPTLQQQAYTPSVIAEDMRELQRVLDAFFAHLSPADWDRPTEQSGGGWTLRETIVHLASVAELYHVSLEDTLNKRPGSFPQYTDRMSLRKYNREAIQTRGVTPPQEHINLLFECLDLTCQRISSLSNAESLLPVHIFAYNRPLTILELAGAQLAHPGITHAAQLANAVDQPPLWTHYSPDMLDRQLTRFISSQMSVAYLAERGGNLRASINLLAGGARPGAWHLTLTPEGGNGGAGKAPRAVLTFRVPEVQALCRLFTNQTDPFTAMLRGKLLVWGNLRLALRFGQLFLS